MIYLGEAGGRCKYSTTMSGHRSFGHFLVAEIFWIPVLKPSLAHPMRLSVSLGRKTRQKRRLTTA